jgi:hypothetical protein
MTQVIRAKRPRILIRRSALVPMRLRIDWPAHRWTLEEASLPRAPAPP